MAASPLRLLALPEEILLLICNRLPGLPRDRTKALISLSLVCKQFNWLALEVLLSNPTVEIWNLPGLVGMYFNHPKHAVKVRTLEIRTLLPSLKLQTRMQRETEVEDFVKSDLAAAPVLDPELKRQCEDFIMGFNTTLENQIRWIKHLETDFTFVFAFQALVLAILPKLDALLLGTNALSFCPILREGAYWPSEPMCCTLSTHAPRWKSWNYGYLKDVSSALLPRLRMLELPGITPDSCHLGSDLEPCFDPIRYNSLNHLILRAELLAERTRPNAMRNPSAILPKSVQTLTITSVMMDERLHEFLEELYSSKLYYPALRRVELFCDWNYPSEYIGPKDPHTLSKVAAIVNWASQAKASGLEVFLWTSPLLDLFRNGDYQLRKSYMIFELRMLETQGYYEEVEKLAKLHRKISP